MTDISIIIPIYNIEDYLDECISSLSAQNYDSAEFILVDDGSTDSSGMICDRWAEKDSRIKVLHTRNSGVSEARNAGLKASIGQWIGFVDGDDWLEPNAVEYIMTQLRNYPSADGLCFGFFDHYAGGHSLPKSKYINNGLVSSDKALESVLLEGGYFTSVWNKIFKRNIIFGEHEILRFDPSLSIGEDEKFLMSALAECKNFLLIKQPLYHYRYRENSVLNTNIITNARIESLYLKRSIADQFKTKKEIYKTALARLCNRSIQMLIAAYCASNQSALARIKKVLNGTWRCCLSAKDISPKRKIKVLMVYAIIKMYFPVSLAKRFLK